MQIVDEIQYEYLKEVICFSHLGFTYIYRTIVVKRHIFFMRYSRGLSWYFLWYFVSILMLIILWGFAYSRRSIVVKGRRCWTHRRFYIMQNTRPLDKWTWLTYTRLYLYYILYNTILWQYSSQRTFRTL